MNNTLLLLLLCCGNNDQSAANCCDPMTLILCCLAFSKCLGTNAANLSNQNCSCWNSSKNNGAKSPRLFLCRTPINSLSMSCNRIRSRRFRRLPQALRLDRKTRTNRRGLRNKVQKRDRCRRSWKYCLNYGRQNRRSKNPYADRNRSYYCLNNTYCTSFSARQKPRDIIFYVFARHLVNYRLYCNILVLLIIIN